MRWHALAAACPHGSAAYAALLPTQLSCCSHSSAALPALLPTQLRCSHSTAAFTAPLSTQLYCLHSSAVPTAPLPSQLRCARRPAALTALVLSRLRCAHGSLVYRPAGGERVLPASTCGFAQLPLLLPLLLLPRTRCCLCSPRRYCRLLRCCSAVHALARLRAPALASYVRALTRRALTSRARSCRLRAFARCMLDFCLHSGQAAHRGCTFLAPHGLQAEPVSGLALGCYELPRPACHLLHRSCSCRCSCRVLPLANCHQLPRSRCHARQRAQPKLQSVARRSRRAR